MRREKGQREGLAQSRRINELIIIEMHVLAIQLIGFIWSLIRGSEARVLMKWSSGGAAPSLV